MFTMQARMAALRATQSVISRLPPAGHPESIASRLITPRLLALSRARLVSGRVNAERFDLRLGDYTEMKAWLTGSQDRDVLAFCCQELQPGGIAVDLGANVGFISVPLGRYAQTIGARVLAVEALPSNAERLHAHVSRAELEDRITVVLAAVGDRLETLQIAVDAGTGFTTNGVLVRSPTADHRVYLEVQVQPLGDIFDAHAIERIDVLKIDVEGFEPKVLEGARALFERGAVRAGVLEVNEVHLAAHGWSRDRLLALLDKFDVDVFSLRPGGDVATDLNVGFRAR